MKKTFSVLTQCRNNVALNLPTSPTGTSAKIALYISVKQCSPLKIYLIVFKRIAAHSCKAAFIVG